MIEKGRLIEVKQMELTDEQIQAIIDKIPKEWFNNVQV